MTGVDQSWEFISGKEASFDIRITQSSQPTHETQFAVRLTGSHPNSIADPDTIMDGPEQTKVNALTNVEFCANY